MPKEPRFFRESPLSHSNLYSSEHLPRYYTIAKETAEKFLQYKGEYISAEDLEDVVQDVMSILHHESPSITKNVDRWISVVTCKKIVTFLDKRTTREKLHNEYTHEEQIQSDPYFAQSAEELLQHSFENRVAALLDSRVLTKQQKNILQLFLDGKNQKEIAETLKVDRNIVDQVFSRIRKKIVPAAARLS